MKFTAFITPGLLDGLGSNDTCEIRLQEVFQNTLWETTLELNREWGFSVKRVEACMIEIGLELNARSAEIVKDMLHEALIDILDPEYDSDIEFDMLEDDEGDCDG